MCPGAEPSTHGSLLKAWEGGAKPFPSRPNVLVMSSVNKSGQPLFWPVFRYQPNRATARLPHTVLSLTSSFRYVPSRALCWFPFFSPLYVTRKNRIQLLGFSHGSDGGRGSRDSYVRAIDQIYEVLTGRDELKLCPEQASPASIHTHTHT